MSNRTSAGARAVNRVHLSYQLLRNTTSPDEQSSGVQSFVVNLPAPEILKLGTRDNLRNYIAEYNPRKRNRVHDAIRNTILNWPERFITRNGGIVITASEVDVDDRAKTIVLVDPSIINGAQTQGEIRRFLEEIDNDSEDKWQPFHVRAEIIIDGDPGEIVETAIARNTATPVKSISQAGARGHLDDLEESIQTVFPGERIRKSETDDGDVLDTQKLLQYARLLMPSSVSRNNSASEKLRAYKNPGQCLADFSDWYESKDADPTKAEKYQFCVDIAPLALKEYMFWERHDGWNGFRLWESTKKGGRACRRDKKSGRIIWVAPGILYPLLSAMGEFVVKDPKSGKWIIDKPNRFRPDEMLQRTVNQFRAHNSDPMMMGRSEAAYDALRIYPQTLVEVLREIRGEAEAQGSLISD